MKIAVIPGDGIGPDIIKQAYKVLDRISKAHQMEFEYQEVLMGGIAIDHTGLPLPEETLKVCKNSDAVLLGAVGGEKWDNLPGHQRPEAGLFQFKACHLVSPAEICFHPEGRGFGGRIGYYGGTGIDRRHLFRPTGQAGWLCRAGSLGYGDLFHP